MYITLQSSTCFEHHNSHLQEDKFYYHSIWYRHSLYSTLHYAGWEQSALQSAVNWCTEQPFPESDDTRCCENKICPPEDGYVNARNMSRIVV